VTQPALDEIPDLPEFIQAGPLALCSLADIAGTLGLSDVSGVGDPTQLTPDQTVRIPYLLAKLCALFRREAGREFTPGTTTVDMMTLAGYIPLPDPLGDNGSVAQISKRGHVIDPSLYTVDAQDRVWITERSLIGTVRPGSGEVYTVTYTHTGEVPWDVRATMAAAVARYLTVDPNSAVAQSTFLSAEGNHQRIAAWVADVVRLEPEDITLARSHRAIQANVIVAKLGGHDAPYMDWGAWQWGGIQIW
jgi:hypothetical protein